MSKLGYVSIWDSSAGSWTRTRDAQRLQLLGGQRLSARRARRWRRQAAAARVPTGGVRCPQARFAHGRGHPIAARRLRDPRDSSPVGHRHHRSRVPRRARLPPSACNPECNAEDVLRTVKCALTRWRHASYCGAATPTSTAQACRRLTTSATWAPAGTSSASTARWPTSATGSNASCARLSVRPSSSRRTPSYTCRRSKGRPPVHRVLRPARQGRLPSAVDHDRQQAGRQVRARPRP